MIKVLPGPNSKLEEYFPFVDVDFIISDIDGTLISGSDSIIKQIKNKIKNLRQQKVQITVATGRNFYGTKMLLQDLEIKTGMPIALYNGGVVMEFGTENVLYKRIIDCNDVKRLLHDLLLITRLIYIYTFEIRLNIFEEKKENFVIEKVYCIEMENYGYDVNGMRVEKIGISEIEDIPVISILISKKGLSNKEIKKILENLENNDRISFTDSGNGYIEIKANGLNKSIIFEMLKNQNKYQANKILAIGDNDNDEELFKYADISVAVANSSAVAIEMANYICENESANGFLDMLNVLKTAKKYCR
ncbi:MAG: HAD-IIB family hydrolase [Lachnospiraceae bacterium]|nr:HAD-IIB family hydrolase [Lachnospiraceae bacterium]